MTHLTPALPTRPRGVRLHKYGRYEARIMIRGRRIELGYYDTAEEAHTAYVVAGKIGRCVIDRLLQRD